MKKLDWYRGTMDPKHYIGIFDGNETLMPNPYRPDTYLVVGHKAVSGLSKEKVIKLYGENAIPQNNPTRTVATLGGSILVAIERHEPDPTDVDIYKTQQERLIRIFKRDLARELLHPSLQHSSDYIYDSAFSRSETGELEDIIREYKSLAKFAHGLMRDMLQNFN